MEKIFNLRILSISILLVGIFLSIGYSAFDASLVFEDMVTNIRAEADIRVTGISIESGTTGALAEGENYDVNGILTKFTLPDKTSSITYRIRITNFGGTEMGIYEITGLPDYLDYSLSNYTLKDKICDKNNKCSLGIVKDDILLTIKYKNQTTNPSIINHNINLKFEFRDIYKITYSGITNNGYPTQIMSGETLKINFSSPVPYNVVAYIDGVKDYNKYTYSNGVLTIDNVTGNVLVEYVSKVYLTTLSEGAYFKESTYLTSIKTVQFVDYIDIPSDRLATYDLSENEDGSIMGWIDKNYNLYIGSDWKIYGQDLSHAFRDMSGVTSITFDNFDTSEATTMYYMFSGMSSLTSIDVSSFNTVKVRNMARMFNEVSKVKELDLSNFNTSNATQIYRMFSGMSSLTSIDVSSFDTSKATDLKDMFYNCSSLTSLDVSNFNTANVTSMSSMFHGCSSLTSLDLSNFNTSNVTNMPQMFYNCNRLTSLDLSNFNTSKVTNMSGMFQNMDSITSLDLSSFDTSKVTNMGNMFTGCSNLTSLDVSSFDTSNVTLISWMFQGCSSLTELDVSNFNTSKVTDLSGMFFGMRSLTKLNLSSFDTSKVTNMGNMFNGCKSLSSLDFRNAIFDNVTTSTSMFSGFTSNVYIIVKDDTARNWMSTIYTWGKNIVTVAELT